MSEIPTPADYVAVEFAGKAAGIPAPTLRYLISTGKLAAIAGKRGKLVSMAEVEQMARMVGKSVGNMASVDGNPATSAGEPAGNIAKTFAGSAIVSDAARLQLATIRDEWLAPLIACIGELERENGRLEAERDGATSQPLAKDETIAELRRRAKVAEAELFRQRKDQEATQAAQEAPQAQEAPAEAQGAAPGVWGAAPALMGGVMRGADQYRRAGTAAIPGGCTEPGLSRAGAGGASQRAARRSAPASATR